MSFAQRVERPGGLREKVRDLEADLLGQGVKLFPSTRAGDHAHLLWLKIKQPLFRGSALQITAGVLKLDWHRQKLKRARQIVVEMGLIRRSTDGRYVLGRYDWLDDELRERFSELKVVEEVLIALSGVGNQVKDPDAA